jgi:hypothetical protein
LFVCLDWFRLIVENVVSLNDVESAFAVLANKIDSSNWGAIFVYKSESYEKWGTS